ncbi:MAG: class I SAM-dependent RNA methyltransferase [bacterium]
MTPPIVRLTINELAGGGDGVGRLDDRAVFVPGTAPGDTVRVRLRDQHRRWCRAELVEVVDAGPDRRLPACDVADRCGGCQWQHVGYEAQLRAKQQLLRRAFRQARLDADPAPLVASPRSLAYRCRARLRWTSAGGAPALGFLGARSHRVVDLTACPILLPALSSLLPGLREQLPRSTSEAELRLLGNEQGHCALGLPGELEAAAAGLGAALPTLRGVQLLTPAAGVAWGDAHIDQEAPGATPFWTSPATFFQANPAMNRLLRAQLDDWVGAVSGPLLELFAGTGNLTRTLASHGAVIAVESQPAAVQLARRNLDGRDVKWVEDDAGRALATLTDQGFRPGLVVLDPPRAGAREVMGALAAQRAPRILYVSCDPMTLARDVAGLAAQGYALRRLRAFDTMPQTSHFETLAELERI